MSEQVAAMNFRCFIRCLLAGALAVGLWSGSCGQSRISGLSSSKMSNAPIRVLAAEITAGIDSDSLKVRAIYRWITTNIAYDETASGEGRINTSASDVLKRRKAVCYGFAQLLQEMCQTSGIPSHVISGYARQGGREPASTPDHAWNSVLIGDKWRLMDVTWGATQGNTWLFTSPDAFLLSHYPAFPAWQLRDCPVDFDGSPLHACGYRDSLKMYLAATPAKRRFLECREAYALLSTDENAAALAHALVDLAVADKEAGDRLADTAAQDHYKRAIRYFEKAAALSDLYAWQNETRAYTHMHYARNLYNALPVNATDGESLLAIRSEFNKARAILQSVERGFLVAGALSQCEAIIAGLDAEIATLND